MIEKDVLKDIYVNVDKFINYAYVQDYYNACNIHKVIVNSFMALQNLLNDDVNAVLLELIAAQENEDYILMADLYEASIKPFLTECLYKKIMDLPELNKYTDGNREYVMEYSNVSVPVINVSDAGKHFYLASNINPFAEAEAFVCRYCNENVDNIIIYGAGCGYHIKALCDKFPYITVEVYESDVMLYNIFIEFFANYIFPEGMPGNVKVVFDPDFSNLAAQLSQKNSNSAFIVHQPSLRLVKNKSIREKIENYVVLFSTMKNSAQYLKGNFIKNIENDFNTADSLRDEFAGNNIIFIAGGPSLDEEIENIRSAGNYIIVSVGTVFKKLMNNGIIPNYVIMTDPKPGMIKQVEGIDTTKTKLLYLSTCDYHAVLMFEGEKYMLFQQGYDEAEQMARSRNSFLVNTGGSVSTTAIDLFIKMNCKKVVCVGLDLALPGNRTHASETVEERTVDAQELRKVKAVDGGMVPTLKNLDIYRNFIENDIKNQNVRFINASGGAYINGMEHMKFLEAINE
ncbi:MAG: motility associated factor glycosyltransferase family protein [Lachnospiraceae bacterium]